MSAPHHFDVDEVMRQYDAMTDEQEKQLAGMPGLDLQLRFGRLVTRAFYRFIVEEQNLHTDPLEIAQACGAGMANMVTAMTDNLRDPLVVVMFSAAMKLAQEAKRERGPGVAAEVYPTTGGHA